MGADLAARAALVAFLRAQLDEEEREALWAKGFYTATREDLRPNEWARVLCDPVTGPFGGQARQRDVAVGQYASTHSDPARVLAEVKAKRAVLAAYEAAVGQVAHAMASLPDSQDWIDSAEASRDAWEEAVDLLAQPYAGRSGWQDEWNVNK